MSTAVLALAGPLTACSGGEDRRDVTAIEAELGEPVEIEGRVMSVSPQGVVLAAVGDETCTFDLDGDEVDCWALDLEVTERSVVSWSSDGAKFVTSDGRLERAEDTDIAVVDIGTGTKDVLTDDGTDESSGDLDVAPIWVDDDTVAFLRAPSGEGGLLDRGVQLVRLDIDEDAEPEVHDTDADIVAVDAAALGGDLLVSTVPLAGASSAVERIEREGESSTLVTGERSDRFFLSADRSGTAVVVSGFDLIDFSSASIPATYVRGDDDPIESDLRASLAAVDPTGRLVAAQTLMPGGDPDVTFTLWDPDSGETVEPDLGDELRLGFELVWTDDDRIVVTSVGGWTVIELTDT